MVEISLTLIFQLSLKGEVYSIFLSDPTGLFPLLPNFIKLECFEPGLSPGD